ncbi:MAG TPA: hypothetical protein VK308_03990 [Pyrinomonadaceae bacterium]|nr:hypothetical protein [Pyrinomonadaceae bacterium]
MNEQNKTVIVVSNHRQILEELQNKLKNYKVEIAADVEEINQLVKQSGNVRAVIIQFTESKDLMCFEFCSTANPSIPLFAIIDDETNEKQELVKKYDVVAIFSEKNTATLETLINFAPHNLKPGERDQNAHFLRIFGDISRELGRLHDEFTETALRTLPQPYIAQDTRERLTGYLLKLQDIKITP